MTGNDNKDNNDINDDDAIDEDNHKVNKNEEPNMATAATKKNKAATIAPKKAGTKTAREDVININTPPRKKQCAANRAAAYFLTKTLKGHKVNQYSKGSKNRINVDFHEGGVPAKSAQPKMSLNQGGKALQVKWKQSKRLFTDEQAWRN
jgi:hypothetical protein